MKGEINEIKALNCLCLTTGEDDPLNILREQLSEVLPETKVIMNRTIAVARERQRLMLEGYYDREMNADLVRTLLIDLASHLDLRTYGEPIVHAPEGLGKGVNEGYDAFVPLIDSGISAYVWTSQRFYSIIVYSCKAFEESAAVEFVSRYLNSEPVFESF